MHLHAILHARLDLIIIEQDEFCVSINKISLNDATTIQGNWKTFTNMFKGQVDSHFSISNEGKRFVDGSVNTSLLYPIEPIRGIDFHFHYELTLPLPNSLPSSIGQLIEGVRLLERRQLQVFIVL